MTAPPLMAFEAAVIGDAAAPWAGPVTFDIGPGEAVALLGANGAGKSSLLRAAIGLAPVASGALTWRGTPAPVGAPAAMARLGVGYAPEGRRVFPGLTAEENLLAVADTKARQRRIDRIWTLFPRLAERRRAEAWRLSGGEQQMLAIGRALMREPSLLLLDEPSLGLAPMTAAALFDAIAAIKADGVAILLAEQSVAHALALADRAIVLRQGRIVAEGAPASLGPPPAIARLYLGDAEDSAIGSTAL